MTYKSKFYELSVGSPLRLTLKHIIVKVSNTRDKERILKTTKEAIHHVQESLYKILDRFLSRNFAAQKAME